MRKIGLDVGDRTIGVAVSDPDGIIAQGITTIERVGIRKDCGKVMDYIREYDCDTAVVGLPLKLDGTDSPQTEKVREFRRMLENKNAQHRDAERSGRLAGRTSDDASGRTGADRGGHQPEEAQTGDRQAGGGSDSAVLAGHRPEVSGPHELSQT